MLTQRRLTGHAGIVLVLLLGLAGRGSFATAADDKPDDKKSWILAVGAGGHRMLSPDGITWEKHIAWGEPKHDQNDLNVAVNYKGTFFAGGGFFSGRLTGTRDGVKWSDGVIPGASPIFGLEVYNDTLYCIDLRGVVFKSTDGEKWKLVVRPKMPTPTHWIRACAQGNDLILGSGDFGPLIAFDPKTETITVTQMDGQKEKQPGLRRVAFGNGVFVIGGEAGLLAVTKDGKTFEYNKSSTDLEDIHCVMFTGKEFLAITQSVVLRSPDGVNWRPFKSKVPAQVRLVNDWMYARVGNPAKLSRTQDLLKWEPTPDEKNWRTHGFAYGPLAGGAPPNPPSIINDTPPKKSPPPKK